MPLAAAAKNVALNAIAPDNGSLHTANPGSAGGSEVSGGSPAYARKSLTWTSASAGILPLSNSPVFDVPASTTVVAVGLYKSGVYYGYVTVGSETFTAQGTYTITSGSIDLMATASA